MTGVTGDAERGIDAFLQLREMLSIDVIHHVHHDARFPFCQFVIRRVIPRVARLFHVTDVAEKTSLTLEPAQSEPEKIAEHDLVELVSGDVLWEHLEVLELVSPILGLGWGRGRKRKRGNQCDHD